MDALGFPHLNRRAFGSAGSVFLGAIVFLGAATGPDVPIFAQLPKKFAKSDN
jgi:hypothetical protein